jgi:hypothetical protein
LIDEENVLQTSRCVEIEIPKKDVDGTFVSFSDFGLLLKLASHRRAEAPDSRQEAFKYFEQVRERFHLPQSNCTLSSPNFRSPKPMLRCSRCSNKGRPE